MGMDLGTARVQHAPTSTRMPQESTNGPNQIRTPDTDAACPRWPRRRMKKRDGQAPLPSRPTAGTSSRCFRPGGRTCEEATTGEPARPLLRRAARLSRYSAIIAAWTSLLAANASACSCCAASISAAQQSALCSWMARSLDEIKPSRIPAKLLRMIAIAFFAA